MHITDLITVERITCVATAADSKQALNLLSDLLVNGRSGPTADEIAANLTDREYLCSTGLGRGVAIPHGRVRNCTRATGAILTLKQGVNFGARDHQAVDLLFGFIVPEQHIDEHLEILALLANLFRDKGLCEQLRRCTDAGTAFNLLTHWQAQTQPA